MTARSSVHAVFAAAVLRERRARGWSQTQLAEKAGVSLGTVVAVERQRYGASLETAARIAGAFGMKVGDLTDGEGGR